MPKVRKSHPPSLKAKVAVEAIKAHKTAAQIAQIFGVHPTQVGGWKKQALAGLPDIFGNGREQVRQQADADKDELYKQIGQLKVELDFLKKCMVRPLSVKENREAWEVVCKNVYGLLGERLLLATMKIRACPSL